MKIKMILTNAFDPDPRVYKEAKALVDNGDEVEILCWDRDNRYLLNEIEYKDNIRIKRFYPKSKYGSGYNQIYSYLKFIYQTRKYLKNQKIDVVHAHDIDGFFVSLFIKGSRKLIWDMHEFYDGFNYGFIKNIVYEKIAKLCFKNVDALIYVSDSQKERYENKKKQTSLEVVILNAPDENLFCDFERKSSGKLRISFIGCVREYDILKKLMDVGERFEDVIINLNGVGVAYDKLIRIKHNYKNTNITGKFYYDEIKKYYENADVIYAVYNSDLLNVKYAFPVKGFEAIITETPIITNKNTQFGDFVEKHDIGFTIDERNDYELEDLVSYIITNKELLRRKVENIRKIKDKFVWNEQSKKLISFYENFNKTSS